MGHLGCFSILLIGPLTCLCVWGKLLKLVVQTRECVCVSSILLFHFNAHLAVGGDFTARSTARLPSMNEACVQSSWGQLGRTRYHLFLGLRNKRT